MHPHLRDSPANLAGFFCALPLGRKPGVDRLTKDDRGRLRALCGLSKKNRSATLVRIEVWALCFDLRL